MRRRVEDAAARTLEGSRDRRRDPRRHTTSSTTTAGSTSAGTVIDVMVVYTPASRARYGQAELESMILNAFAAGNQAFVNSRIDVAMNLVYLGEIAYAESGDMTKTLTAAADERRPDGRRARDPRQGRRRGSSWRIT